MAILRAANESLLSLRVEGLPDDELRVLRMHGEEGLSRLFEFDLELVSENPAIPFANVVGQPATLTFSTVGADRPVNGLVRRFEQGAIGRRFTRYHLRLVPGVWRLQQRVDCRIFQAKTTLEIVQEVLQAAGIPSSALRANLKASYAAREYCVQYQESDWAFICRLLEEEGIFYFFEHRPSQHILVLGDDPSAHGDIAGDATVVFREPSGFNPENEYVGTFRFAQAVHTGAAALRDYSFIRPNQSLETLDQGELDTDLEAFEYPGFYNAADQGSRLASVRRQEREAERRRAVGHSVCRRLVPGYRFTIANHARDDFNAAYLLTHLVHDAYEPQALEQEAPENESETEYRNEFRCIPSSVPFRPRRTTRRPAVRGPQSAVVVGPAGEEIYTDEYGRIKVQFHWDRVGTSDEKSSCWIRVATPWAGAQWGAIQIPRIGWEVMVAFLDGDLDRPVVIASLYNANQMPPYSLPDNKTQSGIKSASSPGPEGFTEIRFEVASDSLIDPGRSKMASMSWMPDRLASPRANGIAPLSRIGCQTKPGISASATRRPFGSSTLTRTMTTRAGSSPRSSMRRTKWSTRSSWASYTSRQLCRLTASIMPSAVGSSRIMLPFSSVRTIGMFSSV